MADISNVRYEEIKDITESLEGLSCMYFHRTKPRKNEKSQFLILLLMVVYLQHAS